MATIEAHDLIMQFYKERGKELYPKLTRKEFVEICSSPFRYLRIAMAKEHLPTLRFKKLGKFEPNIMQMLWFLRQMDAMYLNKGLPRPRYEELKIKYINYLKYRIQKLKDTHADKKARGNIYAVNENKYNSLLAYYEKHLIYEALVPEFADDLKTNKQKYYLLPRRESTVQDMVLEEELFNEEDFDEDDDTDPY